MHIADTSFSGSKNAKTFRPKKNIPEGTNQYELKKYVDATLGSGNLRQAVVLPAGEDLNEWVAVNSECRSFGDVLLLYLFSLAVYISDACDWSDVRPAIVC